MEPRQASSTADENRERDKDYIQFFLDLGIEDDHKDVFLAGLLRNYHAAAAKLDKHLTGYSAAVHAAVSRLAPATSAHDAPEHLWIRVHDRLGFFHDEDRHAQRVVNVGMAFAYRHLEMNSIASANAQVLHDLSTKAGGVQARVEALDVPHPAAGFVAPGGLVIGNLATPPTDSGGPVAGGDESLKGEASLTGAADGRWSQTEATKGTSDGATKASQRVVIGDVGGAAAPSRDGNALEVAAGSNVNSKVASGSGRGRPPCAGTLSLDGSAAIPFNSGGAGLGELPVKHLSRVNRVHAEQPSIAPTGRPLAAVKQVLASIADRVDIDDAVRELMVDSVLFFARNHSTRNKSTASTSRMETPTQSWAALGTILERWWAMWEAPPGVKMMAPPGTSAYVRGSGRCPRRSKWCYAITMQEANEALQGIAKQHSRYFKKSELPDVETVERLVEKDSLPLTRCVAVMLLLGMMEPEYVGVLVQLGSTGRGEHSKNAHISAATCNTFLSSGLDGGDGVNPSPLAPTSPSPDGADAELGAPNDEVSSFFTADVEPGDQLYADVARAGAEHAAVVAKDNRAVRKKKRQRHAHEPTTPAASGAAAPSAERPPLPPSSRMGDDDEPPPTDVVPSPSPCRQAKAARFSDPQDGSILQGASWGLPSSPEEEPPSIRFVVGGGGSAVDHFSST